MIVGNKNKEKTTHTKKPFLKDGNYSLHPKLIDAQTDVEEVNKNREAETFIGQEYTSHNSNCEEVGHVAR